MLPSRGTGFRAWSQNSISRATSTSPQAITKDQIGEERDKEILVKESQKPASSSTSKEHDRSLTVAK